MNPAPGTFVWNLFWTIIFGVFGLVGAIFGIVSWISAKKKNETYDYLFKLAAQNIDRDVSNEELSRIKSDIKSATNHINDLQRKIQKEIPNEARRATLKDRLYAQTELLNQTYLSIVNLNKQLADLGIEAVIPPELMRQIEDHINPDYVVRQTKNSLRNAITITTTLAAILPPLFIWIPRNIILIPLLSLALIFVFRLMWLSRPKNQAELRQVIISMAPYVGISIGLFFLIYGLLGMFIYYMRIRFDLAFASILAGLLILGPSIILLIYKMSKNRKKI